MYLHGCIGQPGHQKGVTMPSNQAVARERAYQDYVIVAKSNASTADKDTAWAVYIVKLAADPGAQQASKKH